MEGQQDRRALQERLRSLEQEVARTRDALARQDATAPHVPPMPHAAPEPPRAPYIPMPPMAPPPAGRARAWEEIVGRKWSLWAGTAMLFVTVALLLAMNWRSLGPWGQLGLGAAAGLSLLAGGAWSRRKVDAGFAAGLTGGGLAILYLDVWAAMTRCYVLSFTEAMPLMVGLTVVGVVLSLRYNAVSLCILSAAGGFLTPALLGGSAGIGSATTPLLAYVAVLNAGILAVACLKRWRSLMWLAFGSTVLLLLIGSLDAPLTAHRVSAFAWFTLYLVQFVAAASYPSLADDGPAAPGDIALLSYVPLAYFAGAWPLIRPMLGAVPSALALGLSAAFALYALAVRGRGHAALARAGLGLSVLFVTVAVPIQLRQGWVAVGWSVEAATLIALAGLHGGNLLRRAGQAVWVLSLCAAVVAFLAYREPHAPLLVNPVALPLLVLSVSSGVALALLRRWGAEGRDELAAVYAGAAVFGGAMVIGREAVGTAIGAEVYAASWALATYAVAQYAAGRALGDAVYRASALCVTTVAAVMALFRTAPVEGLPLWNHSGLAYMVNIAALVLLARWTAAARADALPGERDVPGIFIPAALALGLWGTSWETYGAFRYFADALGPQWARWAQSGVSLVWTSFAAGLLIAGVAHRRAATRWAGLGLFGATLLKVVVVDLGALEASSRLLSTAALGVALIGASWLYTRTGVGREEGSRGG